MSEHDANRKAFLQNVLASLDHDLRLNPAEAGLIINREAVRKMLAKFERATPTKQVSS